MQHPKICGLCPHPNPPSTMLFSGVSVLLADYIGLVGTSKTTFSWGSGGVKHAE